MVRFEATPDFALYGTDRIFGFVNDVGVDPVVCALINDSGKIINAYMLQGTGSAGLDRQVLAKLRSLPFMAARGENGPLTASHRLKIWRSGSAPF